MKLVVTGGTGFTGSCLVPMLLERGHRVRCLLRESSNRAALPSVKEIDWAEGDLGEFESLLLAFSEMDALVNVASIGFGHTPNIVRAAVASGIKRAVFISTTAVFTTLNAKSKRVRVGAEEIIRKSALDFTILRPTMIYGSSRDRNISRLIRYLKRFRVIPVFGKGDNLQQPVYVGDVAGAIAACLSERRTVGRSYNIPGAEALTYNEVIDTICDLIGRKVIKARVPASAIIGLLAFFERMGFLLPFKAEQVMRLNEDKAFEYKEATKDFGYAPRSFAEGIAIELKELGLKGSGRSDR